MSGIQSAYSGETSRIILPLIPEILDTLPVEVGAARTLPVNVRDQNLKKSLGLSAILSLQIIVGDVEERDERYLINVRERHRDGSRRRGSGSRRPRRDRGGWRLKSRFTKRMSFAMPLKRVRTRKDIKLDNVQEEVPIDDETSLCRMKHLVKTRLDAVVEDSANSFLVRIFQSQRPRG